MQTKTSNCTSLNRDIFKTSRGTCNTSECKFQRLGGHVNQVSQGFACAYLYMSTCLRGNMAARILCFYQNNCSMFLYISMFNINKCTNNNNNLSLNGFCSWIIFSDNIIHLSCYLCRSFRQARHHHTPSRSADNIDSHQVLLPRL